jgi:hypothetical protein
MKKNEHTASEGKKRKAHIISVEQPDSNGAVRRPWHRQVSNIKINPTETG